MDPHLTHARQYDLFTEGGESNALASDDDALRKGEVADRRKQDAETAGRVVNDSFCGGMVPHRKLERLFESGLSPYSFGCISGDGVRVEQRRGTAAVALLAERTGGVHRPVADKPQPKVVVHDWLPVDHEPESGTDSKRHHREAFVVACESEPIFILAEGDDVVFDECRRLCSRFDEV